MRQPLDRADGSRGRGFGQEWMLLFARAYAVLLPLGGAYLVWLMRHRYPGGVFVYQSFYIGLYLVVAALPVAVETAIVTLLIRVLGVLNPRWRHVVPLVAAAATMFWFFPPSG